MTQNLVSATLSAADSAEVLKKIAEAKSKMPFLSTLQATDISTIFKVGNAYLPFIDKIYQVVTKHPEILPAVFDKDEFIRDYELLKNMLPIQNQINELEESIQKTYTAVGSDVLVAALDVYASVKQNKDKVPGLSATGDELSVFFRKAKAKQTLPK